MTLYKKQFKTSFSEGLLAILNADRANKTNVFVTKKELPVTQIVYESVIGAASDETTALTTGLAKLTFRAPYVFTLTGVKASLTTASSSGVVTVDINKNGTTVLSTKITIDANELTSVTAAIPAVISTSNFADDDSVTIDIDTAGTGAAGLKITLIGHQ